MSRSIRRGVLAATALALPLVTLAACGAGNNAETSQISPDNARVTAGDIRIQNAVVITPPERDGDTAASVSARIFNNGSGIQTLKSLTIPETGAKAALKGAGGKGRVTVPPGGSVLLGGEGNASAIVAGGSRGVTDGNSKKLVFAFSGKGRVEMSALVVPATEYYADYGPTESPTPSPTGTPDGEEGSPSPSAPVPAEAE